MFCGMKKKVKLSCLLFQNIQFIILIILVLWLTISNYQPGTTLSGWDTIHPEFDLSMYFQRTFFGAWQTHQGLGAPAAQSHLAEITRLPLVWALQIFPTELNRYLFIFICYAVGCFGFYFFVYKHWLAKAKGKVSEISNVGKKWIAMTGALAYSLNLIVLQHFFSPLEMFAVHFATLPFLFWTLLNFLQKPSFKTAGWFFLVQVLSTSTAHTATLWYIVTLLVGIFAVTWLLIDWVKGPSTLKAKSFKTKTLQMLAIMGLVLAANLFWLAPNLYYVFSHSHYVRESIISRSFSSHGFWSNVAFGGLDNVLIGRNFLFDWRQFDYETYESVQVFADWAEYWESSFTFILFYVAGIISLFGIVVGALRKNWHVLPVVLVLLITVFFLNNFNFPSAPVFGLIWQNNFAREALRLPFTKFSLAYAFFISIFFSEAILWLWQKFKSIKVRAVLIILASLIIAVPMLPAFTGHLINPKMQVKFPSAYQEFREWMRTHHDHQQRVLQLPITSYHGWDRIYWPENGEGRGARGYFGQGFQWFGLPQALIHREFDRWVDTNEGLYRQLRLAMVEHDWERVYKILNQYQIKYIVFDDTVANIDSLPERAIIDWPTTEQMLAAISAEEIWYADNIRLFRVPLNDQMDSFLIAPSSFSEIRADAGRLNVDWAFLENGNYFFDSQTLDSYPFAHFEADRSDNFISFTDDEVILHGGYVKAGQVFVLPEPINYKHLAFVSLTYDGDQLIIEFANYYLDIAGERTLLPQLRNQQITLPIEFRNMTYIFVSTSPNDQPLQLINGQAQRATLAFSHGQTEAGLIFNLITPGEGGPSHVVTYDLDWSAWTENRQIVINQDGELNLVFNNRHQLTLELGSQIWSCSGNRRDVSIKETDAAQGFILHANNSSAACRSFGTWAMSSSSYIFRIIGSNHQGPGFSLSINDHNNVALPDRRALPSETDFETILNVNKGDSLDQSREVGLSRFTYTFLSPSMGEGALTINELSSFEVYPLDLRYWARARLISQQSSHQTNHLQLSQTSSRHGFLYTAYVENPTDKEQLLVLNQSYDSLWRINITSARHVRYNGWANGWLIPPGFSGEIRIYYLPQLWTFGGMAILLLTGTGLIWGIWRREALHARHP